MTFETQYTAFPYVAYGAAAIAILFLSYIYWRKPTRHTGWLMLLGFISSGWLITNTLELVSPSPQETLFWAKICYLFIPITPLLWFCFSYEYFHQNRHTESALWGRNGHRLMLLAAVPLITSGMALTNDWHGILWAQVNYIQVQDMLAMKVTHGPWFLVHLIYSYGMVWGGALLIALSAAKANRHYQRQSWWLVMGALVPSVVNILYLASPFPELQKDYTPVSFALAVMFFGVGMIRHQLFELVPIARNFVVDSIHDAIFVLDHQGRVVDLNQPARQMLGDQPVALGTDYGQILTSWPDLLAYVDAHKPFLAWVNPADREETPPVLPLTISGQERMISVECLPLTVDGQKTERSSVIGGLLILRDFTLYKRAEERLHQRTAELESRNRELDAFAHSVAHDLRNPLAAITGYGDLLRMECESNPELLMFVEELQIAAQNMENIIDSLLILAKVRHQEIDLLPLGMDTLLRRVLTDLGQPIAEKKATIHVANAWPEVRGYAPWVSAVWTNYLTNALKYGGPSPQIELGADEYLPTNGGGQPNHSWVRFWVRDHGPGLRPEQQAQVFQTFTRFHQSTAEGYGLGLSIVARMVERMGGEVGVESEPGQGARFWFTLPRIDGRMERVSAAPQSTARPAQPESNQPEPDQPATQPQAAPMLGSAN